MKIISISINEGVFNEIEKRRGELKKGRSEYVESILLKEILKSKGAKFK